MSLLFDELLELLVLDVAIVPRPEGIVLQLIGKFHKYKATTT